MGPSVTHDALIASIASTVLGTLSEPGCAPSIARSVGGTLMRRRGRDRGQESSVLSVGESPCAANRAPQIDHEKSPRCVFESGSVSVVFVWAAVGIVRRKEFTTNGNIFLLRDVIARNPLKAHYAVGRSRDCPEPRCKKRDSRGVLRGRGWNFF